MSIQPVRAWMAVGFFVAYISTDMQDTLPAVSAAYRETLALQWRARSKQNEDLLFDELVKDHKLFPTDPDRATVCRTIARKLSQAVMRAALTLTLMFVLAAALLSAHPAHAAADCNQFESIQSVILSEGAYQPLAAQLEIARVAVTKGACFRDEHFYGGYGVAQFIAENEPAHCILSVHCRAYFMLYTIPPDVRENAAIAAHIALTESPPVARYHFDAAASTPALWWFDARACPSGFFIVGDTRVC